MPCGHFCPAGRLADTRLYHLAQPDLTIQSDTTSVFIRRKPVGIMPPAHSLAARENCCASGRLVQLLFRSTEQIRPPVNVCITCQRARVDRSQPDQHFMADGCIKPTSKQRSTLFLMIVENFSNSGQTVESETLLGTPAGAVGGCWVADSGSAWPG